LTDTTPPPTPTQPGRVLPSLSELDSLPFWEATKNHELRFQTCSECSSVVFYPRSHCPNCNCIDLRWETSRGRGTIYTYTVIRRSLHPAFKPLVPYIVAWVDLDEQFRILTHVVEVDPDDPHSGLAIGARVAVQWLDFEELSLPAFRLAQS
jgi:uncharacterized OB-fold protein